MKNKTFVGTFAIVLSSLVFTPAVFAQTTLPTRAVSESPRPTRVISNIPQAKSCEVLTQRMKDKLAMYQEKETIQIAKYQRVVTVTTVLLDSLAKEGKDTTQARTDLATFSSDITKLQADFTTFSSKMTEVTALPCTNVQMYLSKIQDARALLRVVRMDHGNIQKFYNSILRTDLLMLKGEDREVSGTRTISPRPSITHVIPSISITHFPPGPAD